MVFHRYLAEHSKLLSPIDKGELLAFRFQGISIPYHKISHRGLPPNSMDDVELPVPCKERVIFGYENVTICVEDW